MTQLFTQITARIVAELKTGTAPWVRPWSGELDPLPLNALTGKPYRGINTLCLQMESFSRGCDANRWLTFRQAQSLGAHIRKGATGTPVVFWQLREQLSTEPCGAADHGSAIESKRTPMLRIYTVFNIADVIGLPDRCTLQPVDPQWDSNAVAESLLTGSAATIEHAGFRAYYQRAADLIRLPRQDRFATAHDYYATALHELSHWTGHEQRCNRQFGKRFGDQAYAFEELVAELSAAFLCAHCRIDGRLEHAAYIDNWLRILQADERAVLLAATQAQKAADYVLATSQLSALPLAA